MPRGCDGLRRILRRMGRAGLAALFCVLLTGCSHSAGKSGAPTSSTTTPATATQAVPPLVVPATEVVALTGVSFGAAAAEFGVKTLRVAKDISNVYNAPSHFDGAAIVFPSFT